ncbi:hypothetical protein DIPPA_30159 [Diplonema papillatum]|nr:hypothetical protein DIPPA_30159 [Diplonema papillatum]
MRGHPHPTPSARRAPNAELHRAKRPAILHSTPPNAHPPVAPRLPSFIELPVSALLGADSATGSAAACKPAQELFAPAPQQPASPRLAGGQPAGRRPEMADADTDLVSSACTSETPPARPQDAVDAFSLNGDPKR